MKTIKFITIITLTILSFNSFAQETSFTGTWLRKSIQAISGSQDPNVLPTQIKVDERKDSLIIETPTTSVHGEKAVFRQAIAMNGTPCSMISQQTQRKLTMTLQWSADKSQLTITTAFSIPGGTQTDFTRTDHWSIEGSKLTIDRKTAETPSNSWESKGIYEKQ